MKFRLERDGDTPLAFEGSLLSEATSQAYGKKRWFEVRIYATDSGKYVVEGAGMSDVPGEEDRCWAVICDTPDAVIRALYRTGDAGPYLTRTSQSAIEAAAMLDDGISAAYVTEV